MIRLFLALLLTACGDVGAVQFANDCRWIDDGTIELDWAPGEACKAVCTSHPFKVSPVDPAHEDYVQRGCETCDCYEFTPALGTEAQVWRDPAAGFAANLGAEDWFFDVCRTDTAEVCK
jgi:hypothetical protein